MNTEYPKPQWLLVKELISENESLKQQLVDVKREWAIADLHKEHYVEKLETKLKNYLDNSDMCYELIGYFCDVNMLTPEKGNRIEQVVDEAKHDPDVFPLYKKTRRGAHC